MRTLRPRCTGQLSGRRSSRLPATPSAPCPSPAAPPTHPKLAHHKSAGGRSCIRSCIGTRAGSSCIHTPGLRNRTVAHSRSRTRAQPHADALLDANKSGAATAKPTSSDLRMGVLLHSVFGVSEIATMEGSSHTLGAFPEGRLTSRGSSCGELLLDRRSVRDWYVLKHEVARCASRKVAGHGAVPPVPAGAPAASQSPTPTKQAGDEQAYTRMVRLHTAISVR